MFQKDSSKLYCRFEKAIGFYYDKSDQRQTMQHAAMSVDELEELTGIDFFHQLDDETENRVESSFSLKEWNAN